MFRNLMTIMALAALLMSAACNDIVGPTAGENPTTEVGRPGGGDRHPQEFEKPELLVPEDPGGGGGDNRGDVLTPRRLEPRRDRNELSPGDTENGGGGEDLGVTTRHPRRQGDGQVCPTP
jgi:hypothetical protein